MLFLISATSTGMAVLIMVYVWKVGDFDVIKKLAKADAVMIVMEIVIVVMLIVSLKSSAPAAASVILSGEYALLFWGGIIGLGLLIPFVIEVYEIFTAKTKAVHSAAIPLVTGMLVLFGGFLMRYVMLYAGQV